MMNVGMKNQQTFHGMHDSPMSESCDRLGAGDRAHKLGSRKHEHASDLDETNGVVSIFHHVKVWNPTVAIGYKSRWHNQKLWDINGRYVFLANEEQGR